MFWVEVEPGEALPMGVAAASNVTSGQLDGEVTIAWWSRLVRRCRSGHGEDEDRQDECQARSDASYSSGAFAVRHVGVFLPSLAPLARSITSDHTEDRACPRSRQHKAGCSNLLYQLSPLALCINQTGTAVMLPRPATPLKGGCGYLVTVSYSDPTLTGL